MSQDHNHLNHATWECKYHVVFTAKYRKKMLFGQIRRHLGSVFHELARCKECQIEEGHLMPGCCNFTGHRVQGIALTAARVKADCRPYGAPFQYVPLVIGTTVAQRPMNATVQVTMRREHRQIPFSLIKSLMRVVSSLDCSADTRTFSRGGIGLVHSRVRRAAHVGSLRCRSVLGRKSNSRHKVAGECRGVHNAELAGTPSAHLREPRTAAGVPSQMRGLASGSLRQSNRQWPPARPQPRR